MRPLFTLLLPLLAGALCASIPTANAQSDSRGGNFTSAFELIVDNCKDKGASLDNATIAVTQAGRVLRIKIPTLPDFTGAPGKRGKLRASAKSDANAEGLRGKFGFNGRIRSKKLRAVLVAEFFDGDKPLCTQTWSVQGKIATQ